jgi:hypothetical protein
MTVMIDHDASLTHLNIGGFDQALASVSDFDLMRIFDWSSCWTDSTYSTTLVLCMNHVYERCI